MATARPDPAREDRQTLMSALGVPRSRTEEARNALLDAILHGILAPGTLHSVADLAEGMGVSRTPVREALLQLSTQGLVRFERNRGVRILGHSDDDIRQIYAVRMLLESPLAGTAATQRTNEQLARIEDTFTALEHAAADSDYRGLAQHDRGFHLAILDASGNAHAMHIIAGIRDLLSSLHITTTSGQRSLIDIAEEHTEILDAISNRDPEAAEQAMREHLEHTRDLLLNDHRATTRGDPS